MGDSGLVAIDDGRAWADLSAWRKTLVSGPDARGWLEDLVTASVADLSVGLARRSLLLSPTGRIRADFTVASLGEGLLLVQDPDQPDPLGDLLRPYVLSAQVVLEERDRDPLLAFLGGEPPSIGPGPVYRPSALGSGFDVLLDEGSDARSLTAGREYVSGAGLEAWRIHRGMARFPVDLTPSSLPHEAGLDHLIAYGKGCFLGQEAVAKVKNLGHPTRVVLALLAPEPVETGDAIVSDGETVGEITSATDDADRIAAIGRVGWGARESSLTTSSGARLQVRGLASGTA